MDNKSFFRKVTLSLKRDNSTKKRSVALLDFSSDLVQMNKQILDKHFSLKEN